LDAKTHTALVIVVAQKPLELQIDHDHYCNLAANNGYLTFAIDQSDKSHYQQFRVFFLLFVLCVCSFE
jgi:hypothetical protein